MKLSKRKLVALLVFSKAIKLAAIAVLAFGLI